MSSLDGENQPRVRKSPRHRSREGQSQSSLQSKGATEGNAEPDSRRFTTRSFARSLISSYPITCQERLGAEFSRFAAADVNSARLSWGRSITPQSVTRMSSASPREAMPRPAAVPKASSGDIPSAEDMGYEKNRGIVKLCDTTRRSRVIGSHRYYRCGRGVSCKQRATRWVAGGGAPLCYNCVRQCGDSGFHRRCRRSTLSEFAR